MRILGKYRNRLIAIALLASFFAMMSVSLPVRAPRYEEDPISGVLEADQRDIYSGYSPLSVKVEIDEIVGWPSVIVEIHLIGSGIIYRGELEEGESTPWKSTDGGLTDIHITNDGLDELQYWGTICMYLNR